MNDLEEYFLVPAHVVHYIARVLEENDPAFEDPVLFNEIKRMREWLETPKDKSDRPFTCDIKLINSKNYPCSGCDGAEFSTQREFNAYVAFLRWWEPSNRLEISNRRSRRASAAKGKTS